MSFRPSTSIELPGIATSRTRKALYVVQDAAIECFDMMQTDGEKRMYFEALAKWCTEQAHGLGENVQHP